MLAGVFAVAAAGKLRDVHGTRQAAMDFGAPDVAAGVIARLLPILELAVAVAVLVPRGERAGAIGALALLAIFSAAIARSLRAGDAVECHCFGQMSSEPIGPGALVRNGGLAVVAALVAFPPGGRDRALWEVIGGASGGEAAAFGLGVLGAVALVAPLALAVLRRHGRALERIDVLESSMERNGLHVPDADEPASYAGLQAPDFREIAGVASADVPLLALFTSSSCPACDAFAPVFSRWREEHGAAVTFVELDFGQHRAEAAECGVTATPAAVLVDGQGRIAGEPAHGADAIEALVHAVLDRLAGGPRPRGDRVPAAPLDRLDGPPSTIGELLAPDRDSLVLFWNPTCGYCSAMRGEVDEIAARDGAPGLVVVSTGAREAVEAEGFAAPVLLDPGFDAATVVGVTGTPSAVRARPDGSLVGTIAVGAEAILAMAQTPEAEPAVPVRVVQVDDAGS